MKIFSTTLGGYVETLKWGVLALFVVGLLRFLMAPVGIPIGVGGKATSITLVLLAAIVVYAVRYALAAGTVADVVVSTLALALAYAGVIALFLSLSVGMGVETYYTDPGHFQGSLGAHVLAHLQVTPFATLIGSVIGGIAFGLTRLVSFLKRRSDPASS